MTDWLFFSGGLVVGALVTIATSPFAGFFDPCLVQWATMVAAAFYFYLYMSEYMDSNFTNNEYMLLMLLNFAQFGQATQLGYCGMDHGFRSGGFHTSFGIIELDSTHAVEQLTTFDGLWDLFFGEGWSSLQDDEVDSTGSDTTNSLLAIIGIYGILQAYQAF